MKYPINISMCGFGGQGIILLSVLLGTTAVTKGKLYAVQTQSYGSEARGGQCQAELILRDKPIGSPISERKDILVCMFQDAYDKYIPTLKDDGVLIIDHDLVKKQSRKIANTFEIPATEMAITLGNRMVANMIMLGFICEACGIVKEEDLVAVVKKEVAQKFVEINIKAINEGVRFAKEHGMFVKELTEAAQ